MKIWIDADACPTEIRKVLFRACEKRGAELVLVASQPQRAPTSGKAESILVAPGEDAADNYIADHCEAGELVVTADVPLASRVVDKGATALSPRGQVYTEENIKEHLSMRNFMEEMRFANIVTGGPRAHAATHTQDFSNALDRILTSHKRNGNTGD